jgi:hypothetical protein
LLNRPLAIETELALAVPAEPGNEAEFVVMGFVGAGQVGGLRVLVPAC